MEADLYLLSLFRFVRTKLMFVEETSKDKPANAQPAYYFGNKVLVYSSFKTHAFVLYSQYSVLKFEFLK